MDYNKQKKIRSKLINFTNQQLKIRKAKNVKFLINSISLEELEKKNLQCKEFIIIEKPQFYQNINNDNSIVEHIYINNKSFTTNIVIFPLSSRIINKESENIDENGCNNLNITSFADFSKEKKERIIQKIAKGIISKKEKNLESPNYQPCLIKKELMERKIKKLFKNNEINSHHYKYFNKEKKEKEKEKIENNKKELNLSKQLSSETIATEISRIIRICYNDKSINSSGISRSNSRIDENDEIKKAKQFAKKLKYYCYTLKNKFPIKDNINKNKKNDINIRDIKNNDNKDKSNNLEDKINYYKIKNKKYNKDKLRYNYIKKYSDKIKEKNNKHISNDNLNLIQFLPPTKRMKSDRNIKFKNNNSILSEDNYNNNTEQSTNIQYQYKTLDNDSRNKNKITNIFRASKKLKKKLTGITKQTEQNEKKSPIKTKKKEIIPELLFKKIKNKIADINKRETKRKKDKKNNIIINNHKNELPSLLKNKHLKRQSIDIRMFGEGKGLESIIFDTKNLSTSEDIPIIQKINKKHNNMNSKRKNNNKNNSKINKKKITKKKNNNNNNNNQILTNIEDSQEIRKSLKKPIQKTNTFYVKKKATCLNLSKKVDKKRKLSTANDEDEEKVTNNNTIDFDCNKKKGNQNKITFKLGDDFSIKVNDNYNNEESDDLNLLDDYLYNKKVKRIKNTKKINHN